MRYGGGARSLAAKRRGPNVKAVCAVCGKGISNRMVYRREMWQAVYAHQSCAKRAGWTDAERCW